MDSIDGGGVRRSINPSDGDINRLGRSEVAVLSSAFILPRYRFSSFERLYAFFLYYDMLINRTVGESSHSPLPSFSV